MRTANRKLFRAICLALLVALGLALTFALRSSRASAAAANLKAERQLTFEERVAYQRAIEEVYWRGRLWPAANAQPKPSLDAVMPAAEIEAKVADYLRKSQALEDYWQRPISAEQLQAELDRMASETRQPDTLRELHRALGDDPLVIAECLARPALVERLIRNWYAHDERFHGELKQRAERELLTHGAAHQLRQTSGEYAEVEWAREERAETSRRGAGARAVTIDAEEWKTETRQFGRLREDEARFYVMAALEKGKERMKVAVVEWRKEPFEQWWARAGEQIKMAEMAQATTGSEYRLQAISAAAAAGADNTWAPLAAAPAERYEHVAVWTGSEMIVWGGQVDSSVFNTGGRYNPATDTWTATSLVGAPAARAQHTAVWTGSEMIVWGGLDSSFTGVNTGGRYNPASDSWIATNTVGAPVGRHAHTAVWTGTEMIVWGGFDSSFAALASGGRYNPASDNWTATSLTGAPAGRRRHTAVWTGSEMIVWGGQDASFDGVNSGGRYNPGANSWTATSGAGAPAARYDHTALWTGSEMVVWGGQTTSGVFDTGGRYNPTANSWMATSLTGVPTARHRQTAVWTGSEMIVWGGRHPSLGQFNTGGRYNPASDSWVATNTVGAPAGREIHKAVWTGSEMIVWGGQTSGGVFNTGGRYNPASDSWIATSGSTQDTPTVRYDHTAVWTGSEMIVWGGQTTSGVFNTGGRYNPATGGWTPTNTTGAPTARHRQTAVWTGSEMIVWGGRDFSNHFNTGGRYNPASDSWVATNTVGAPAARNSHTAVWTGNEMIVWGGEDAIGNGLNSGGRYNPASNSWGATNTVGAPAARAQHTAVWTGSEMIVWGGQVGSSVFNTGGRYNPATDTWIATSLAGAPAARAQHTAVWTGSEMIVWGGFDSSFTPLNTGGRYNPASDSWSSANIVGVPAGRREHTAVWTGSEMIVWGGRDSSGNRLNSGGRYNPASDNWTATSLTDAPAARSRHTAVWTGNEMIVWGGQDSGGNGLNSGGRYFAQAGTANTPPTIAGTALTRTAGSPAANAQIAAVNDAEEPENFLTVTVNGAASAAVNGVTVSGLSVNSSGQVTASVVASCTATTAAFTLRVTDGGGLFDEATLDVTVNPNPPPSLGTYSAASATAGSGATVTPDATPSDNGSIANITATAPGFTGTFSGNPATGVITITSANPPGSYTVTVTATDNCGAQAATTFGLTVSAACSVTVNPATLPNGTVGAAYNQTVSAAGGTSCSFQVNAGALPTGLQLNAQTGVISGTPTAAGVFNFTIRASCANACTASRAYTVTISSSGCSTITLPALPATGAVGSPYAGSLVGTTPTGTYNFTVSSGSLPPGVTLNNIFKVVSGTPTTAGTYNFTIKAIRSGTTCEGVRSYTVTITATVAPMLNCVQRNQNGTYTARFGYDNSTGAAVTIPVGANNYFTPGNQNRGQATVFQPGHVTNAFSVTFTKGRSDNLAVWYLRGPDNVLRPVSVLTTSLGCP